MILTGYTKRISLPECNPSSESVYCIATLNEDVMAHPKIEVFRADRNGDLISRSDGILLAVAGDKPPQVGVPCFDGSDVEGLNSYPSPSKARLTSVRVI